MSDKKKLFLVDAMALIYRAHFAFIKNPRINSKGMNTSAVFGFVNALLEVIEKENPTHMAVAFDSYEPTARHGDFAEYKANRDKQPEDITIAVPVIKSLLEAFKIPVLEVPGYEADDLIATLSSKADEEYDVFMFTPDKDFAQLVGDNVYMLKPARMGKPAEVWDVAKVLEEFGIKRVDQVIEIQGLMGDSVDNIPGVPGIGPKTAQKLISEFDNIENLLENTDKLKGKVKENLEKYADQARVSRQLARLLTDAPVDFDEPDLKMKDWDKEKIEQLFAELEFKNLGKRVLGKEPEKKKESGANQEMSDLFDLPEQETEALKKFDKSQKSYTEKDRGAFFEWLDSIDAQRIAMHFEYSNPNPYDTRIKVIAASVKADEAVCCKLSKEEDQEKWHQALTKLFKNEGLEIVGYGLKFLVLFLKSQNIEIRARLLDNHIAHYIIDSEGNHEFDASVEKYLHYKVLQHGTLDTSEFRDYYCEKADMNGQLFHAFEAEIKKNDFTQLFYEIESPLIPVLAKMEFEGVRLDKNVLADYSKELANDLKELEQKIHKHSGVSFNINSPQQLGHVLFDILKLDPKAKKTKKSKQYSTSEDVLQKLAPKHEIVQLVLDYRGVQKLKSTYVDALPELIHEKTGRVHTTFDQAVAATGRLSSKNPNLQNIPIRTERGRYIRKAFIPGNDERVLFSADYSQVELRIIAHTSGDEDMIKAFNEKKDIHTATAAKVFGVRLDEVTADMRRKAKEVNFGLIYGISSWGLAQRLNISRSEGKEIKEQYFKSYPKIKEYMDRCVEMAREQGYAETLLKRRRYLRDINSRSSMQRSFAERNAVNAPIQGTAADIIKMAMVNIQKAFDDQNLKSKMILQVHDELVFDVYKKELEEVKAVVKDHMENALKLDVPLDVEMGQGNNWLEAH